MTAEKEKPWDTGTLGRNRRTVGTCRACRQIGQTDRALFSSLIKKTMTKQKQI
jgi:hypothetical protein